MKIAVLGIFATPCLLIAVSGDAQTLDSQPSAGSGAGLGHLADSAVGEAGQRQTRAQAAEGIAPTVRIASRVENRVQSRIRSRIDRNYGPQASATSLFEAAEGKARTAGQIPR